MKCRRNWSEIRTMRQITSAPLGPESVMRARALLLCRSARSLSDCAVWVSSRLYIRVQNQNCLSENRTAAVNSGESVLRWGSCASVTPAAGIRWG